MDPIPNLSSNEAEALNLAKTAAGMSTCLFQQVGAVVLSSHGAVLGWGFNQQPESLSSCRLQGYCNRPGETCENQDSPSRAIHAEFVAIAKALQSSLVQVSGGTLVITHRPCLPCLKLAITAEIRRCVYLGEPFPEGFEWHQAIQLLAVP